MYHLDLVGLAAEAGKEALAVQIQAELEELEVLAVGA
jgi:hypothetical protein